jgi:hypothetical protein
MPEPSRRFPPPWHADTIPGGYVVRDASGQSIAYVYRRETEAETRQANVLTKDEARRIAANIARLPELLGKGRAGVGRPRDGRDSCQPLTQLWHTDPMPTGRHTGHRGPNIHYKARSARANRIADELAPVIAELQAAGITSLNGIAAALNERRVATPAGGRHWHAAQVSRILKRLAGQARRAPRAPSVP